MRNIASRDASELEALEQREWLESLDYVIQQGDRGRVQRLLERLRDHARVAGAGLPFTAVTPYVNTHPRRRSVPVPGQPGNRASHQEPGPLECHGHGRPRESRIGRDRRPHLDVRLGRDAVRSGLQPLLPRQGRRRKWRPDLFPGTCVARHLRARVSGGPPVGREADQLPAGAGDRRRPLVVPAPLVDARLLGVPDRLDGTRADHVDLPGALQSLPRGPRAEEAVQHEGVGVPRRR